jgi:hypothetical protein
MLPRICIERPLPVTRPSGHGLKKVRLANVFPSFAPNLKLIPHIRHKLDEAVTVANLLYIHLFTPHGYDSMRK